jgi:endonuclease/exonuclease/phosphatase family metal-dependent hydrolase
MPLPPTREFFSTLSELQYLVSENHLLKSLGKITRRIGAAFAILYPVFLLGCWLLLYFAGDRWWFATFLLFSPRWIYGIPLIVLVPWAIFVDWRLLGALAIGFVIFMIPLMGFCFPWQGWAAKLRPSLRIVTCNVDGEAFDPDRFESMMQKNLPDIVLIQECPAEFVEKIASLKKWNVVREGQLLTASRYPLKGKSVIHSEFPPTRWPPIVGLYCLAETPEGEVAICNIHLSTPRFGLAELLDRRTIINPNRSQHLSESIVNRTAESNATRDWAESYPNPKVIAGDFNMPVDSAIYRRHWGGYSNAFSRAGFGYGDSKITPVLCFKYGLRIDHVLMSEEFLPYQAYLGADVASDHLPVVADLDLSKTRRGENSPKGPR